MEITVISDFVAKSCRFDFRRLTSFHVKIASVYLLESRPVDVHDASVSDELEKV